MKYIFIIFLITQTLNATSQTNVCFNSPDGVDQTWTGGWSYKEYIIPSGYKIDSVYGDFDRPGYPSDQEAFIFHYCPGTTIYDLANATQPFNYATITYSLYDHWINLDTFNYASVGVVRVFLPVNAGAIWNNLCLAISPSSTTEITEFDYNPQANIFPNPSNGNLTFDFGPTRKATNINIKITNMFGQIVYLTNIDQQTTTIDLSKIIGKGFYTIQSFFTSGVQIGLQKLIIK